MIAGLLAVWTRLILLLASFLGNAGLGIRSPDSLMSATFAELIKPENRTLGCWWTWLRIGLGGSGLLEASRLNAAGLLWTRSAVLGLRTSSCSRLLEDAGRPRLKSLDSFLL